jgi:glyoxylase-like metal-dependent hydrolase (beta-lactamase superfamily II)/rhodanese-related sulfurtransferase
MVFRQFYLSCLAQASYLIGSNGEAAVVDPRRDVDEYLAFAEAHGLTIKYVIETHLHADFVSGHGELAERSGATIVFGARANAEVPHFAVRDGDVLHVGEIALRILETPGHTPESICILVNDEKLLTGDTLFIGDVGRPDLAAGAGHTPQEMASMMYDTIHTKLLALDDAIEIHPGHGAGSLCGKSISKETSSTIGQQRRFNYALQPMSREAFVEMTTSDVAEAPRYFAFDARTNRAGARALADLPRPRAMTVEDVAQWHGVVLDVRAADAYCAAHVPGSIHIGMGGQFASWAGSLLLPDDEIALVADTEAQIDETVLRLARVGLENARGALDGGFRAWTLPAASAQNLTLGEAATIIDGMQFIDVRRSGEYHDAHARGAVNMPLNALRELAQTLDRDRATAVICAGGYRSAIGISVLERLGFRALFNVAGGTTAWLAAGLPAERAAA